MMRSSVAMSFLVLSLAACSSSSNDDTGAAGDTSVDAGAPSNGAKTDAGAPVIDAGSTTTDAGAPITDAGSAATDAGSTTTDAGAPITDAGSAATDAGSPTTDAGRTDAGSSAGDAGASCHAVSFGQAESIFIVVPSSQFTALTGGTIVEGTYDLVGVETSSNASSSWTQRSTWKFAGNTIQSVDQLKTSSLGPVVTRTASYTVSGGRLTRTYTCGSSDATPSTFDYDSKVVSGFQTIRVQSGTLRFTFEKRP
jgi:hypothetical protein